MERKHRRGSGGRVYVLCLQVVGLLTALVTLAAALLKLR